MVEYLPIFGTSVLYEKMLFNCSSIKDQCELYSIICECIEGPCTAIVANEEIIYNTYNPARLASNILTEDIMRERFAKNPRLIIFPYNTLKIVIYHPTWCMIITYNDGYYKLMSFTN